MIRASELTLFMIFHLPSPTKLQDPAVGMNLPINAFNSNHALTDWHLIFRAGDNPESVLE